VSFVWGVYNLALSMNVHTSQVTEKQQWTFGQIAPVILLVAPLLSVLETFMGECLVSLSIRS
jgi:hypothetical protein